MEHWVEVLFGGVGGSALLAAIGWLVAKYRTFRGRVSKAGSGTMVITSPPYVTNGHDSGLSVTPEPERIRRAIKSAPPFARPAIASNFVGLQVDWQLRLVQVLPTTDGKVVHVRLGESDGRFPMILADVPTEKFPFLKFVHEDSLVRIHGKLKRASEHELELEKVEIELLEARLGG